MATGRSTSGGKSSDCCEMVDFDRSPFIVIWEVTRAQAFAAFDDPLAEDPLCLYEPRGGGDDAPGEHVSSL